MKKKLLTRTFGVMLSACLMISSVPVMASPVPFFGVENDAPTEEIVDDTEEISAEEIENEEADTELEETENETDAEAEEITEEDIEAETEEFSGSNIFELDWKNASDATLERYFSTVSDEDIAAWVSSLSEEEKSVLLERDTIMRQTVDVYGYLCDVLDVEEGTHFETALQYFEKIASSNKMRGTFNLDKGQFFITFEGYNSGDCKVEVSKIKTSTDVSERQTELSWKIYEAKNQLKVVTNYQNNWKLSESEKNYYIATVRLSFVKPLGYSVSKMSVTKQSGLTDKKFAAVSSVTRDSKTGLLTEGATYAGNSNKAADSTEDFYIVADMIYNMNVGSSGTADKSKYYESAYGKFTFTPATCKYTYDVNGGTGSVTDQANCKYGQTYSYPAAPTAPNVTVTYNGNGGDTNEASATVPKTFKGWSTSKTAGSGNVGTFKVTNTTDNATITNYAIWGDPTQSVTLPSATKSYKVNYNGNGGTAAQADSQAVAAFKGWADSPKATSGMTGSYTPTASKTLYALWEDGSVTLPTATREGYQLEKWVEENKEEAGTAGSSYKPSKDTTLYLSSDKHSKQVGNWN